MVRLLAFLFISIAAVCWLVLGNSAVRTKGFSPIGLTPTSARKIWAILDSMALATKSAIVCTLAILRRFC